MARDWTAFSFVCVIVCIWYLLQNCNHLDHIHILLCLGLIHYCIFPAVHLLSFQRWWLKSSKHFSKSQWILDGATIYIISTYCWVSSVSCLLQRFHDCSIVSNPTGRKMMRFLYHVSCFVVKSTATFWASWLWHSKENTINTYFHFNLWETSVLFGDPVWASSCESPHSWFYFPEDLTKFSPRIFPHRHFVVTFTHTGIVSKLRASSFSFLIYKYWFVTSIASTYRPPL